MIPGKARTTSETLQALLRVEQLRVQRGFSVIAAIMSAGISVEDGAVYALARAAGCSLDNPARELLKCSDAELIAALGNAIAYASGEVSHD